jgi:hypothetical protein
LHHPALYKHIHKVHHDYAGKLFRETYVLGWKIFSDQYKLHKIEKLILNAVIISSSIIKALPFITLSEDYLIMTNKEVLIFCFNINPITSTAPFGFAAEYAHPIETMVLGVGTVIGPLVLTRHYFTVLVWLIVRLFQTVEAHCGYDFPWSPRHFIPFWGGAEFHDYHHETFVSFSSYFHITLAPTFNISSILLVHIF